MCGVLIMKCSGCKSIVSKNSDICKRCTANRYTQEPVLNDRPKRFNELEVVSIIISTCLLCEEKSKKIKKIKEFTVHKEIYGTMTKAEAVEYKGGKCSICGYNRNHKALVFHHLKDKVHSPSAMFSRGLPANEIKDELDKCLLVCANCHAEIHDEAFQI